MTGSEDPREAEFEDARSELTEGLKSCRAVVRNYRELLTEDPIIANPDPPADADATD